MRKSTQKFGGKALALSAMTIAMLTATAANAAKTDPSELSALIDNGKLSLLSMTHAYGEKQGKKFGSTHDAAQGFKLKFDSGFYGSKDFGVGFGISGDAVFKIDTHRNALDFNKHDSHMLNQVNCTAKNCEDTAGYYKISELYLKAQAGADKKRRVTGEVGYGRFDAGVIVSYAPDGMPIFPTSFEGARIKARWDDFSFAGSYVTGVKKNAQQHINKLYADKKFEKNSPELDYVASFGVKQKLGSINLGFDYAVAESYKQRYAAFGNYTLKLDNKAKVKFEAAYTENSYSGSKFDEHVKIKKSGVFADQDKANLTSLRVQYIDGPLKLKASYSTVGGNKAAFERYMSTLAGKPYQYATGYAEKWRRQGAKAYALQTQYDMRKSGIDNAFFKNFFFDYKFVYGETPLGGLNKNNVGNGIEHVFKVRYYLPLENFKGAKITGRLGKFFGDKGTMDKNKMLLELSLPIL